MQSEKLLNLFAIILNYNSMAKTSIREKKVKQMLQKVPTGINGLDEITEGGLPKSRPTLICGEAGSGKTLFSIEFIVRGATQFNEPGVL